MNDLICSWKFVQVSSPFRQWECDLSWCTIRMSGWNNLLQAVIWPIWMLSISERTLKYC